MKPTLYELTIEPDLSAFSFEGDVRIDIITGEAANTIVLDAHELSIQDCRVVHMDSEIGCTFSTHPERQELVINLDRRVNGSVQLFIQYTGTINDRYAGFYRSHYRHEGQDKVVASTQFEAREARRAFPCFDRPDLKAPFDIELIIDPELTAISNEGIAETLPEEHGKKRIQFRRTPKMSTYLAFWAVGEFEFIQDQGQAPLVRVATTPGKTKNARFALDMARKSLAFGEEFTGLPYPLSKCDYLAIPDSMGAMENFGAIRHSEDVLLVTPGVTPLDRQVLIGKIIAHEGIHMWFGDLVSPVAWKYLWLNEAFATYFTYIIPHHFYPEWGVSDQFFNERMLSGLERDGLAGTLPIDLPGADDPQADPAPTPSTAPIVYNKGAAVIRMLEAFLGEERFRTGVSAFLKRYQFDAAGSDQFFSAVAKATGGSLEGFKQAWVEQPGYPLVRAERTGNTLTLTQSPFCYSPAYASDEGRWVVPVDVRLLFSSRPAETLQVRLGETPESLELPDDILAYKLNAGFTGFYRVQYPPVGLATLGQACRQKSLPAVDRLNFENDYFALLKAGQTTLAEYLEFIENYFVEEDHPLPLIDIARNLAFLYRTSPSYRPQITELGTRLYEIVLGQTGWEPAAGESLSTVDLRNTYLQLGALLEYGPALAFGRAQFERWIEGQTPHQDLSGTVLKIAASAHPSAAATLSNWALDLETPDQQRSAALEALGSLPTEDLLSAALNLALEKAPASLWPHIIMPAARNPASQGWLWDWFVSQAEALEKLPSSALEGLIVTLVPLAGFGREVEIQLYLEEQVQKRPHMRDSLKMAVELLEINQRLRG